MGERNHQSLQHRKRRKSERFAPKVDRVNVYKLKEDEEGEDGDEEGEEQA